VRDDLGSLLSALKESEGVITGSIAQAMVGNEEDYVRRDLNIVVPYQTFNILHKAVEDTLGFRPVLSVPHSAIAPRINRFCIFV
jgi:hypothetical protein